MSTSSTLAEMMRHVMMIAPWAVIGTVESGGSAVGNVTGTKTENAEGPDPANGVDVPVPERGRETDRLEELKRAVVIAGVESERRSVGGQWEETAGVGRGVENRREGAEAEIARETGREARGWMGKRPARETVLLKVGSGCRRNMKEKWVRVLRSVEKGIGTAGAATGTETGAGETETRTGSTRGSGERGTGGNAERSATPPYEMTWSPKMTWPMRMREEHRHTWRSTVRMGWLTSSQCHQLMAMALVRMATRWRHQETSTEMALLPADSHS